MINALIINEKKDTVAVAIEVILKGKEIKYSYNNKLEKIIALEDIEIYHKFAIKDMLKGEAVIKYGEHIGIAGKDIKIGSHVHVHNIENQRENL